MIISHAHKVLFVPIPKCGSTSILLFLLKLHGIESAGNPRKFLQENADLCRDKGLAIVLPSEIEGRQYQSVLHSYYWFSVIRDPYSRILSNYHNKLNRFASRFDRRAYYSGKALQLLKGPMGWGDANCASQSMQRFISFEQFVHRLRDVGVEFDTHYRPQYQFLHPSVDRFDQLIPLERLDEGLASLREQCFGSDSTSDSPTTSPTKACRKPPTANASSSGASAEEMMTPKAKNIIRTLYEKDFQYLRYAS